MTYTDLYLRAADAGALDAALAAAGIDPGATQGDGWAQDRIGTIRRPTGETVATAIDGMTEPVLAAVPGHHANLRLLSGAASTARAAALAALTIAAPATPERVWA